MKTITLAHSDLTKTIYAVIGKEKIDITDRAIAEVKAIKALEQEPKTGRWIWCGGAHRCSNCEEYTCFEDNTRNAPKYCPNCGAKMKRGE